MLESHRHITDSPAGEAVSALTKTSLPVGVSGAALAGVPLETWVMIATLVYTVASFAHLVYRVVREQRGEGRSDG